MKRFLQLKPSLCLLFSEELAKFDWDKIKRTCKLLQPFKECTMKLQDAGASGDTAKKVILYPQSRVQKMNVEVKDVWTEWLTDNPIVEALIRKRGGFFHMMKDRLLYEGNAENEPLYNLDNIISFEDFSKKVTEEVFRIENYMKSFRPASVDPERLFSLCRCSKNYLQNRMTAENHARNVLITKNTQFLPHSV